MKISLFLSVFLMVFINPEINAQVPIKPTMVKVEGGTFSMGSNQLHYIIRSKDENPIHSVTVSSFSIGKYEVTVAEYKAFCNATNRPMPNSWTPSGGWIDTHPMANITYNDAVAYCNWLNDVYDGNFRLPTEAEWEYAARGGNKSRGYIYSGSNDLEEVGFYGNNSRGGTHPVGSKKPNELGLYDMSGNVWEWCQDWYDETYYSKSPRNNPRGPSSGSYHVLRGGAWGLEAVDCRVTTRYESGIDYRNLNRGFRIVSCY